MLEKHLSRVEWRGTVPCLKTVFKTKMYLQGFFLANQGLNMLTKLYLTWFWI